MILLHNMIMAPNKHDYLYINTVSSLNREKRKYFKGRHYNELIFFISELRVYNETDLPIFTSVNTYVLTIPLAMKFPLQF